MLSQTCKIGIKAVIYLASKNDRQEKLSLKEIAEQINASEHTVGKTLQTLVRHRIIHSTKGPSGGFFIDEEQALAPVIVIVETLEGKMVFKECGLGLSKCSETHPCPIHNDYKVARDHIEKIFKERKIQDLCDHVNNGIAFLVG